MKGIQQTDFGFRAFVRVKGFPLQSKRFPKNTATDVMQDWRELRRAKLIIKRTEKEKEAREKVLPQIEETFAADATRYLASVTALTTFPERKTHIAAWVALFSDRLTQTIVPAEIRAQRDRWLTVGPKWQPTNGKRGKRILIEKPLAASSVNHRLRALENMWTVLWPNLPNPVRQVPEAEEPRNLPRAVSAATLDRIFEHLPAGDTKARLEVLRWTGLSAKTLMRLKQTDVDLRRKTMRVPGRLKGKGTHGTLRPLVPNAVTAFRTFKQLNAWGSFSTSGMRSVFQRACERAKLKEAVTPYQLRHTFGTEFLRATNDLRATQHAMNHSTSRLTERYTLGAMDGALVAAYAMMAKSQRRVTTKVATSQKRP